MITLYKDWKKSSIKFTKYIIFEKINQVNKFNEIIFREYKNFYIYSKRYKKPINCQYAIWIDELNLAHIRASNHLFIDGTWYQPGEFKQILIIEYKDIIIKEKIPGAFIITNNKKIKLYIEVLNAFKNIISQNGEYSLNILSITSDDEKAIVKAINMIFPTTIRINCFFHYKKDIKEYFKSLGFTKKKDKIIYNKSLNVISILGKLPLRYNGNIAYIDNTLENLKKVYPEFSNVIENYFKKDKYKYFLNGDLNYRYS